MVVLLSMFLKNFSTIVNNGSINFPPMVTKSSLLFKLLPLELLSLFDGGHSNRCEVTL